MKLIFQAFVVFFFAFFTVSASPETSIVGGVNASPHEFPFLVSLQWFFLGSTAHQCGGVILSNVWIISVSF